MKLLITFSLLFLVHCHSLAQNKQYDLFIKETTSFIDTTTPGTGRNLYEVYFARFYSTYPDTGSFCFAISYFWANYFKKRIRESYFIYVGEEMVLVDDMSNDIAINKFLYKVDSTVYKFTRNRMLSEHVMISGSPLGVIVCSKNGEVKRQYYTGDMPGKISPDNLKYIFSPKPFDMNKFNY